MVSLTNNSSIQTYSKEVGATVSGASANPNIGIAEIITQTGATWNLARISHRARLNFVTSKRYIYDSTAGDGVNVYVLDTGIYTDHVEFESRASWGTNTVQGTKDSDNSGHGTFCAGIIAAKTYGVAKKSNVIAVKVADNNVAGDANAYVQGLEWAVADHQERSAAARAGRASNGLKGSVIFLNAGNGTDDLTTAINAAIDAGVHVVVPAGNDDTDICNTPTAQSNAIIVGASDLEDSRAFFSNFGSCITLFAPGLSILSTYIDSPNSEILLFGSEVAAAHVAGLLAYFLSLQSEAISPTDLKSRLVEGASPGVLSNVPDNTPNVGRKTQNSPVATGGCS